MGGGCWMGWVGWVGWMGWVPPSFHPPHLSCAYMGLHFTVTGMTGEHVYRIRSHMLQNPCKHCIEKKGSSTGTFSHRLTFYTIKPWKNKLTWNDFNLSNMLRLSKIIRSNIMLNHRGTTPYILFQWDMSQATACRKHDCEISCHWSPPSCTEQLSRRASGSGNILYHATVHVWRILKILKRFVHILI